MDLNKNTGMETNQLEKKDVLVMKQTRVMTIIIKTIFVIVMIETTILMKEY